MNKLEVSAYFRALGKIGGKSRWKGKTKKEISEHMKKMNMLSIKKRTKKNA